MIELRQLPILNPKIPLNGKGAFAWIASWATDVESFRNKVSEVAGSYGLFVVEAEHVMPYREAESAGFDSSELTELVETTRQDKNFCIFGTLHNYRFDT